MSEMPVIHVEVVYALPQAQMLVPLTVSEGTTLEEAVKLSGILEKFPEIDLPNSKVGIWNKVSELSAVLREKDRVEIYRPLIADPKEVRRKRAEEGKAMKKGGGDAAEKADS
jgi:putative ubiquitin-RnfH superfamily antitoxin RatB of RatAB toxin-antitoxin module